MLVLMDQCKEVIRKARRQASVNGVSVSLTYLLVRLQQSLQRIDTMLSFLTVEHKDLPLAITGFLKLMANAERDDHSVRALFSRNTELLARNITEHAGHHGEHYVASNRQGYFSMFRSASRAGFYCRVHGTVQNFCISPKPGADCSSLCIQHELLTWFHANSCLAWHHRNETAAMTPLISPPALKGITDCP